MLKHLPLLDPKMINWAKLGLLIGAAAGASPEGLGRSLAPINFPYLYKEKIRRLVVAVKRVLARKASGDREQQRTFFFYII